MIINTVLILFSTLMIWGAVSDIRFYILSNKLCLSVIVLYPIFLITLFIDGSLPSWEYIGYSSAIALIAFLLLVVLFARGLIGGGDVKLIPAVLLWSGPAYFLEFLLVTSICGGFLSLIFMTILFIKKRNSPKSSDNINLSMSKSEELDRQERKIPYGVAISTGGLYVAYQLYIALSF